MVVLAARAQLKFFEYLPNRTPCHDPTLFFHAHAVQYLICPTKGLAQGALLSLESHGVQLIYWLGVV